MKAALISETAFFFWRFSGFFGKNLFLSVINAAQKKTLHD
jgi:hypothetical protein